MADVTNYIDRLVAELCPDGVEYRPLGELLAYEQPTKYLVSSKDYDESYPTPVLTAGKTFILGYTNETEGIYPASEEEPVIIFDDFTTAFKWVEFPFKAKSSAMKMLTLKSGTNSLFKYVYYAMQCIVYNSSDHARQWISKYSNIEIPVPPVEIQEAIVEILDKFTNLEAELEAELEARTLQYEYYRDSLFEALDCPRVPLGELGKFYGGLKGKTKNDFGSSGARYISYKNVYENISADFTWPDFVQVKEGENQLSLMKGDILLTGSSENMEEAGLSSVVTKEPEEKAYLNSFSICYRLNDPSILNPEFSKYLFRSRLARKQIIRTAQGVTRFNVSKKKLANVSVPIPTLEEQQRIVDILDRFDALTSSLSEGLPAELAARRSQYEYYRDQLLTFPRKGENQ